MSVERATDNIEQLAGPARARMGDLNRNERAEADRVRKHDEIHGQRPGDHIQEDVGDTPENFTT